MATLTTLTNDVQDMVYGSGVVERPSEDTLATAVTSTGDTSWQFTTPTYWNRGDYAEDQTAGEIVVFAAEHPSGGDATVRRAQNGTTALAAYSIGDVFNKNPKYPRHVIERFINETIDNDLWPHVYMWGETTVTWVTGQTTYEMPTDCEGVAAVYQADIDSDGKFYPIDRDSWEFVSVVNTAESTNGNYLRLFRAYDTSDTIYVTYMQKPMSSAVSTLSTEVAALVPWRVVGKLLAGTRLVPARTSPGRARPVVNASGSQLSRDFAAYDAEFRRMRADEKRRLRRAVPQQKNRRRSRVRRG